MPPPSPWGRVPSLPPELVLGRWRDRRRCGGGGGEDDDGLRRRRHRNGKHPPAALIGKC